QNLPEPRKARPGATAMQISLYVTLDGVGVLAPEGCEVIADTSPQDRSPACRRRRGGERARSRSNTRPGCRGPDAGRLGDTDAGRSAGSVSMPNRHQISLGHPLRAHFMSVGRETPSRSSATVLVSSSG